MPADASRPGPLVAHSSDLHIGASRAIDESHPLCRVVNAATRADADVLLLAGDIFDHNRVPLATLDSVARILADSGLQVVMLPGNHDCLSADSVYRPGGIADVPGVCVLGVTDERVAYPQLQLNIWGRPHFDYRNMSPLADPPARTSKWHIATAHGHWLKGPADRHRGWLITDEDIESTAADYVALGHWPQAGRAGNGGSVPAFYCGSPDLAATINLIQLTDGAADVRRVALPTGVCS